MEKNMNKGDLSEKNKKKKFILYSLLCGNDGNFYDHSVSYSGRHGKSFVRDGDGLRQHYITLEYWGKYLRQIIKELLIHHRLRIPTWDLHIGFGSDIVTTLHYYVIGDPLIFYVTAFVPVRYTEYLYDFLCFFRYYLAGITFSWYCFL